MRSGTHFTQQNVFLPGLAKVADFSKPMMAFFGNLIAADLKEGNDIMFIMVSSSCFQVANQTDGGLWGQLACTTMFYGVFSTIVNTSQKAVVGVVLTTRKDFT
jgi:hypothetical protein